MNFIKTLILIILAVSLITFCAANHNTISISLFPFPYYADIPIFLFALICMAIGVAIAGLTINMKLLKTRLMLRKIQSRMMAVENENKSLRSERNNSLPAVTKP
jgi:uncharacterized integral membrane protein